MILLEYIPDGQWNVIRKYSRVQTYCWNEMEIILGWEITELEWEENGSGIIKVGLERWARIYFGCYLV